MAYSTKFMHSQGNLLWRFRKLTPYSKNMGDIGCLLTCFAYIISRHDGVDITPGRFLDWIAQKAKDAKWRDYLTSDGRAYFNSVDRFTGGTVVHTYKKELKKYTLLQFFSGTDIHWMVELAGGQVFNPLSGGVELVKQKKWTPTGRKEYFKVTTPSRT